MKPETKQRNIDEAEAIEKFVASTVKPNKSIILQLIGYGFQDGFGENDLKNIPHFGLGFINQSKRMTIYLFFNENVIPTEEVVLGLMKKMNESVKEYKRPIHKRKRNQQVRKIVFISEPEKIKENVAEINPF